MYISRGLGLCSPQLFPFKYIVHFVDKLFYWLIVLLGKGDWSEEYHSSGFAIREQKEVLHACACVCVCFCTLCVSVKISSGPMKVCAGF